MSRTKAIFTGLLAGLVGGIVMTAGMLLLAALGVATPLVIIGDRLSVFIPPGPFLSLMGKVGGYNHLKQLGVGSTIAGQLLVGATGHAHRLRTVRFFVRTSTDRWLPFSDYAKNLQRELRVHSGHGTPRVRVGHNWARCRWWRGGAGAKTLWRCDVQLRWDAIQRQHRSADYA